MTWAWTWENITTTTLYYMSAAASWRFRNIKPCPWTLFQTDSAVTLFCCLLSSMVSLRETSSLRRLTHAWLKYKYRVSKWQTVERKVSRFVTVTGMERWSWCTNLQFSTASASGRIFLILICHLSNSTKTSQQFVKINQRIKSNSTRGSKSS